MSDDYRGKSYSRVEVTDRDIIEDIQGSLGLNEADIKALVFDGKIQPMFLVNNQRFISFSYYTSIPPGETCIDYWFPPTYAGANHIFAGIITIVLDSPTDIEIQDWRDYVVKAAVDTTRCMNLVVAGGREEIYKVINSAIGNVNVSVVGFGILNSVEYVDP